jgi:hypothetical protein
MLYGADTALLVSSSIPEFNGFQYNDTSAPTASFSFRAFFLGPSLDFIANQFQRRKPGAKGKAFGKTGRSMPRGLGANEKPKSLARTYRQTPREETAAEVRPLPKMVYSSS